MRKAKNWYLPVAAVGPRPPHNSLRGQTSVRSFDMRNRFVILTVALVGVVVFSLVIAAQNRGAPGSQQQQGARGNAAPDNRPFNARDLAGIWSRNSGGDGGGGTWREGGDRRFRHHV